MIGWCTCRKCTGKIGVHTQPEFYDRDWAGRGENYGGSGFRLGMILPTFSEVFWEEMEWGLQTCVRACVRFLRLCLARCGRERERESLLLSALEFCYSCFQSSEFSRSFTAFVKNNNQCLCFIYPLILHYNCVRIIDGLLNILTLSAIKSAIIRLGLIYLFLQKKDLFLCIVLFWLWSFSVISFQILKQQKV